jgi:hypothetical protein
VFGLSTIFLQRSSMDLRVSYLGQHHPSLRPASRYLSPGRIDEGLQLAWRLGCVALLLSQQKAAKAPQLLDRDQPSRQPLCNFTMPYNVLLCLHRETGKNQSKITRRLRALRNPH